MALRQEPGIRADQGFTLIELMIVVAIIGIISAIAVPLVASALLRSEQTALAADGKALHSAFMKFNIDNGLFPSTTSPVSRAFNLTTLAPLSTNGYIGQAGGLTGKLLSGQVTAYDSPNVGGPDTQFWAVLTLAANPSVIVLVANTDEYPGHFGTWYDGVYYIQGSSIVPVGS